MEDDELIRVTSLLRWAGVTRKIPNNAIVRAALERGTAVHEWSLQIERRTSDIVSSLDAGDMSPSIIGHMPRELRGYGRAIAKFTDRHQPEWHEREVRKDDHVLGITGQPDRVGTIAGKRVVVDFKTGNRYGWHRLQLALYSILIERGGVTVDGVVDRGYKLDKRIGVYLSKFGEFSLQTYENSRDILEAWSIITKYRNEVTQNDDT